MSAPQQESNHPAEIEDNGFAELLDHVLPALKPEPAKPPELESLVHGLIEGWKTPSGQTEVKQ